MISGAWLALSHFRLARLEATAGSKLSDPVGISVLKPLKGVEDGLRENLVSFLRLSYAGEHEVLFCVAEPDDPACALVQELLQLHPEAPARLLVGAEPVGSNPKINNLARAYREARHDWVVVSDSTIRAPRDYLSRLARHAHPKVGMVTAVVAGSRPLGPGGYLEAAYLNGFYARWMILTAAAGRPAVVGKSMFFRKSVARRFGGPPVLARYIAEDYMSGEAVRWLGLEVRVLEMPVEQHIGRYSLKQFWSRHVRWGRIRKAQAPLPFLGEGLIGVILAGLMGAFACQRLFGTEPVPFFGAHVAICAFCDLIVMRYLDRQAGLRALVAWLARELLAFPLWLHTALGDTVCWQGRRLRILPGGLLADE